MIRFSLILLIIIFFTSCSSKREYIDDFSSFISDIEIEKNNFNDQEWLEIEVQFYDFSEVRFDEYEDDFTDEEQNHIEKLIKRYKKIKLERQTDGVIDFIKEKTMDAVNSVKDLVD